VTYTKLVLPIPIWCKYAQDWGEYRDRHKLWQYAETRSRLLGGNKEKAQKLQQNYESQEVVSLFLEMFDDAMWDEIGEEQVLVAITSLHCKAIAK
jgi:hypothetical protein